MGALSVEAHGDPEAGGGSLPVVLSVEADGDLETRGNTLLMTGYQVSLQDRGPYPAGWFGGYSDDESTYDTDGENAHLPPRERDADLGLYDPNVEAGIDWELDKNPEWFQETESGGAKQAWQTFYPQVANPRSVETRDVPVWHHTPQGGYRQAYAPGEYVWHLDSMRDNKPAGWFDVSEGHFDGFGRSRLPFDTSDRKKIEWKKRTTHKEFGCAKPGCMVNVSLPVFNQSTHKNERCELTLEVHATDFDDEYSREYVDLLSVNGRQAHLRCFPKVRGCGATGVRDLHQCVADLRLPDHFIGSDGMVVSTIAISPSVDECPYSGNLLSGILTVTCWTSPKWRDPPPKQERVFYERGGVETPQPGQWSSSLRCKSPGCTAQTKVLLKGEVANQTCNLSMIVAQTDFDGDSGAVEEIEWVKVDGVLQRMHIIPGGNPCKNGTSRESMEPYVLIDGLDVTQHVTDGRIEVMAKISNGVDECGSDGHLLDANITVNCI